MNQTELTRWGEGSFGMILISEENLDSIIKAIKDTNRMGEMEKERNVYMKIEGNEKSNSFYAKFPKYYECKYFKELKIQKIYSPLSGYGDIWNDEKEENYGYGYVVSLKQGEQKQNDFIMVEDGERKKIEPEKLYPIDKPGNLVHFYINHFDEHLKEKLENDQGILVGKKNLEDMFSKDMIGIYAAAVGELLAFLIFELKVIPNDIEVVLGTPSKNDRVVKPFIYDFNECDFYTELNETSMYRVAKSLYNKNGRFYFPNNKNVYYEYFRNKFTQQIPEREKILELYCSFF